MVFSGLVGGILRCLRMALEKIHVVGGWSCGSVLNSNSGGFFDICSGSIHKASVSHDDFANVFVLVAKSGGVVKYRAGVEAMSIGWRLSSYNLTNEAGFINGLCWTCFNSID